MDEISRRDVPDQPLTPEQARELVARGRADRAAGRTVPHERVMPWLQALAHGERVPRPKTDAELQAERKFTA